jgi:uncharacterized cupin superfamily protein
MARMEDGTASTRLDFESEERFVPLRRRLGVTSFGLNLIVLQPGERGRIHRHERQEEVYVVLEGTLDLVVEGVEEVYEQGMVVRVAPDVRRQLVNRGPGRLALLAMGGANEHHGRDATAYTAWEESEGASPADIPYPEDLPESGRR